MLIAKKINLKKYFLYSLPSIIIATLLCRSGKEYLSILIVYIATVINHILLIYAVSMMTDVERVQGKKDQGKGNLLLLFLAKFCILLLGLYLGILFMGNRVIIPLVNYVILIFVLVLSIRKD